MTANILILVSGMATGILAARLLGPADRGLLAAVMFWPQTIAALASLSLGDALIARLGVGPARRDHVPVSACLASLLLALAAFPLGAVSLPVLLGQTRGPAIDLATLYLAAFLPLSALATALLAADQARQRFFRLNLLRLGPSWIFLAGIGLLWQFDAVSVANLLWATWIGSALTVAARLLLARADLLHRPLAIEMRELLRLGARFHLAAVLALVATQVDRMIVIWAFDDAAVGHYVVAWTFASSGLAVVTSAVSFVLLPALAVEPDRSRARAQLALALQRTALFLYVGVGVSILVTPWLLPPLFGREFEGAVSTAILLLLAVIPLSLRHTIVRCLRAFSEARIGVTSELGALVGFVLACGPLAAIVGVDGIAASTIVANCVGLFVCSRHLSTRHGIPVASWLFPGPAMVRDGWSLALRMIGPMMAR